MRYKKVPVAPRPAAQPAAEAVLLGMLYVVDVRLVKTGSSEKLKHRLLLVGCEHADIERKLRWLFDVTEYKEMSIVGIEKVREKVHFLSTVVTQIDPPAGPVIEREEGSQPVYQQQTLTEPYDPKLFAIGITTTMLGKDEEHALRKLGHAIISRATEGRSHSGASLSADSTVAVEEIPRSNGYASARDVSNESNRAHVVRG